MKYLAIILMLTMILLAGCTGQQSNPVYPKPLKSSSTISTTVSSTTTYSATSILACKDCYYGNCETCPVGMICRQNQCIKVEYSNIAGGDKYGGTGGSSGGSGSGY